MIEIKNRGDGFITKEQISVGTQLRTFLKAYFITIEVREKKEAKNPNKCVRRIEWNFQNELDTDKMLDFTPKVDMII